MTRCTSALRWLIRLVHLTSRSAAQCGVEVWDGVNLHSELRGGEWRAIECCMFVENPFRIVVAVSRLGDPRLALTKLLTNCYPVNTRESG